MNPIDLIYKDFGKILKHYECGSCNSLCCKFSPIRFEKDEYLKIVKNIDPTSREIIEATAITAPEQGFYKQLPPVCPLLNDAKCRVYENRPLVCQIYPFEVSYSFQVVVRPCPMGLDIILDYMVFIGDTTGIKEISSEYDQYQIPTVGYAYVICPIMKGSKKLKKFIKYLKATTPENRELLRKGLK